MAIVYHDDVEQGTDEWLAMRRGVLTASEMKLILTPTLKIAKNENVRKHVYEIAAQRISEYTEPTFIGDDMLRGGEDEIRARDLYSREYAPVTQTGFVTNDDLGFKVGYSPDGLVGEYGLIEIKGRRQKYQVEAISSDEVPSDFVMQLQAGLFVTKRKFIDFICYSGGLPMFVKRVLPDPEIQRALKDAATEFEFQVRKVIENYHANVKKYAFHMTERVVEQEMFMGGSE